MGWVVNATSWQLYPGKETWYPFYRRLGGLQGQPRMGVEYLAPHWDSIPGPSSP
jgi:hypothetical protein